MKKDGDPKLFSDEKRKNGGLSRRAFLTATGTVGALVVAGASRLAPTSALAESQNQSKECLAPVITKELPIAPNENTPANSEYQCDVLVVGGGFAGLNAAVSARKAGCSVLLIDKGRPGYSGLTPFASSHRWLDKELGDDPQAFRECIQRGGEYIANLDWYQVWIDESKAAYQRLKDWQILAQYPNATKAGDYVNNNDFVGYREQFSDVDRRTKFTKVLEDNGIQYLSRTMITDVIKQDGRVIGAMGFDVPSGTVLVFHAKAIVLCMGGGSYKPSGFPTGSNTFDGEYIGYQLGLPVIGKEFDDFHQSVSCAPGNAFLNNSWEYLENIWLCGGDVTSANAEMLATVKAKIMVQQRILKAMNGLPNNDGTQMEDMSKADATRRGGTLSRNPKDPRTGKDTSLVPKGDIYGAAIGMCAHLSSGVFCGLNESFGFTGLTGLYVAGDGMNGSVATGAAYPNGVGFTSSFCSIQGWRAGGAAAQYSKQVQLKRISTEKVASVTNDIHAPMNIKNGVDPNWARDVLQAIMAPYWVHIVKSDSSLRSTLTQVEILRDEVAPKLMATNSHDLRLCHEMKHKILSAEMKLRAGIERKESRGLHYRSDYPYRDDKNFLCYVALQKGRNGEMNVSKIDIKGEWKGDVTQDYEKRYRWRFPKEAEAKGLPEESPQFSPEHDHGGHWQQKEGAR